MLTRAALVLISLISILPACFSAPLTRSSGNSGASSGAVPTPVSATISGGASRQNRDWVNKVPRAALQEVMGWKIIMQVCLGSDLDTRSAGAGDIVWGLLDDDCRFGSKLIAARDSLIRGHLIEVGKTRTLAGAALSSSRRYRSGGCLTIQFDEIIDQDGNSWPIIGKLCRLMDVKESADGGPPRLLQVDKQGKVIAAGPTLTDKEKSVFAVGRALTAVPVPAGVLVNVVGIPAAMGVIGAAYPAFAYNKPVNLKEKGIRQRAFVYGFVTNLPGAMVVAACVQKGDEVALKAGDGLIVDMTFQDNEYCTRGRLSVTGSVMK